MSAISAFEERQQVSDTIRSEIKSMMDEGVNDSIIVNSFTQRGVPIGVVMQHIQALRPVTAEVTAIIETMNISQSPVATTAFNPGTIGFDPVTMHSAIVKEVPDAPVQTTVITPLDITIKQEPRPRVTRDYTPGAPNIGLEQYPTTISVGDRVISVSSFLAKPFIVVLDDVLTPEECQNIIELAKPKIKRSEVVDYETNSNRQDDARTSSGAVFQKASTPALKNLEELVCGILNWPYPNSEGFQVLNYQIGQQYRPHFDHFNEDPREGDAQGMHYAGNRVATVIIYLNTPVKGGGTQFPELGFTAIPKVGRAVIFTYPTVADTQKLLHAGMPPIEGEKWIAVNWYRQGSYAQ